MNIFLPVLIKRVTITVSSVALDKSIPSRKNHRCRA